MIPVEKEPESLTPYGSERCCFCRDLTAYWHEKKDVPVCLGCAAVFDPKDVPSKQEWAAKEMKIEKGRKTPKHDRIYVQSRLRQESRHL